mmetsp:Transcript_32613/g.103988  ORF Transcript_32613/g.103988 Transcript_32613/m.103988 type:complete len:128 (+) Transcript_32613:149-532(+)
MKKYSPSSHETASGGRGTPANSRTAATTRRCDTASSSFSSSPRAFSTAAKKTVDRLVVDGQERIPLGVLLFRDDDDVDGADVLLLWPPLLLRAALSLGRRGGDRGVLFLEERLLVVVLLLVDGGRRS